MVLLAEEEEEERMYLEQEKAEMKAVQVALPFESIPLVFFSVEDPLYIRYNTIIVSYITHIHFIQMTIPTAIRIKISTITTTNNNKFTLYSRIIPCKID